MYEARIRELGISLPAAAKPLAAYVPVVQVEKYLYVSGQLPMIEGELKYKGKLGELFSVDDGYKAARLCAVNCLGAIKGLAGSIDKIEQIIKITGFVNSSPGFIGQPAVVNGASELLEEVFGEAGKHARSAVGVNELPLGAAVELEMIVKVR